MRVVVFAYHEVGCAGLRSLLEQGHDVVAVFTHRDDPEENPWFESVAALAGAHGIPVHAPGNVNRPEWVAAIRECAPQALFSFHYRRMLSRAILDIVPDRAFNLHGSLLPRYRGRCPVNWVLVHGESETGVTLHLMTEQADAGDIVGQRRVPIAPEDTPLELHRRLAEAAGVLLRELLPSIAGGTHSRRPQDPAAASYFGARRPEDGEIDWRRPAHEIHNLVRAVTHPYPGAFTSLEGRRLYVWRSEVDEREDSPDPGRVGPGPALEVGTGTDRLRVLSCQLEGEPASSGPELVRRHATIAGASLGVEVPA